MIFTVATTLTVAAAGVLAAPAPAPVPAPWCGKAMQRPAPANSSLAGQSNVCWKLKRAENALGTTSNMSDQLSDHLDSAAINAHVDSYQRAIGTYAAAALHELAGLAAYPHSQAAESGSDEHQESKRWCMRPGQPCWKAKRDAEQHQATKRWCMRPGQPCWKVKRDVEDTDTSDTVDLTTQPIDKRWCMRPGQPCWKVKRDVEDTDASDETEHQESKRWCMRPGQPCWKAKRESADHDDEILGDETQHQEAKRWCMRPGQPCWKVKRAAESVIEATDNNNETDEAECDQKCVETKLYLEHLQTVARSIVSTF